MQAWQMLSRANMKAVQMTQAAQAAHALQQWHSRREAAHALARARPDVRIHSKDRKGGKGA